MGMKRYIDLLGMAARDGGPGFAQVAVTSDCNAACSFCNFSRERGLVRESAPYGRLTGAVDILYGKGVRYLVFVGGDPLLYPGLDDIVAYTAGRGVEPLICTNGWLLTPERVRRLHRAGLRSLIISVDAPDVAMHEKNRGLPGVAARIAAANREAASLGMRSAASVTVSRLVGDYGMLPGFLRELGFADLTLSYPLTKLHSTYQSFSDSGLVDYENEELIEIFGRLKKLKKEFPVLNPALGMDEMVRFLKGEPARFPCLAGYKYFFLDWKLDAYRCHFMERPICPIEELPDAAPIRDGCARCMIDCYRDPSVLQHFFVNLADALSDLRRGRPVRALSRMLDKSAYLSLMSVMGEYAVASRAGRR